MFFLAYAHLLDGSAKKNKEMYELLWDLIIKCTSTYVQAVEINIKISIQINACTVYFAIAIGNR